MSIDIGSRSLLEISILLLEAFGLILLLDLVKFSRILEGPTIKL